MIAVSGYLFILPILLSPLTSFAQFLPDALINLEDAINPAELRQRYYPARSYWRLAEDGNANIIEIPVDYSEHLERDMTRKPLYSTVIENQAEKRVASGGSKEKSSNSQHYEGSAHQSSSSTYEKRNAFRQLALNGARGFGK